MPNLNLRTFQTIVANQAATIQSSYPALTNFAAGSILRALVEATGSVGLWLQSMATAILAATRLTTSSGIDVDTFVGDFSLFRNPAVAATGTITFARYSSLSAAFLPAGSTVITNDQSQTFSVNADTTHPYWTASSNGYTVPAGVAQVTVSASAITAGSAGNILANALGLTQSAIPFDYLFNANPFTGGVDAETDAALKVRFQNYINSRSLSTPQAIIYAATSVQQGITVAVQENTSANGAYLPGNILVTVDDGSGTPPASLINSIANALYFVRGAGITVSVQPPTVILANVNLTLVVANGFVKSTLQPLVQAAIANYIAALPVGQTMPYSVLSSLAYGVSSGIVNVVGIQLNNSTSDIGGGLAQVVRVGTITIN